MSEISRDQFQQQLNTMFTLKDEPSLTLELTQVSEPSKAPEGYENFSLLFAGQGPLLSQAIYSLEHPELEGVNLFLVPIDREGETVFYESVFNRKLY